MSVVLKGITWGHSRGLTPLQAVSQRFAELNPGIEIQWHKRTLQEFADFPIEQLTRKYDLLIIDHPWVGCAAAEQCVLPLEQYLPPAYLQDQLLHSTGLSHISYQYNGHQWALAIDAATPVASYRPDLLNTVPQTWEEVLELAKDGKVAAPAIPIDLLMNFYTFCIAAGQIPFQREEEVIDEATGKEALHIMKQFYSLIDKKFFQCNPIAVAELMSSTNDYYYCPFAYGYSNYSRKGYAKYLLNYADVVNFSKDHRLRTTIGGTGLSVSAFSQHKIAAVSFAEMAVSGACQSGLYVQHGGQPGHLSAWVDVEANQLTHNYFSNTLPALKRGYMRPRYNGYLFFQDHAGDPLHRYLQDKEGAPAVLKEMNRIYRESLTKKVMKLI